MEYPTYFMLWYQENKRQPIQLYNQKVSIVERNLKNTCLISTYILLDLKIKKNIQT